MVAYKSKNKKVTSLMDLYSHAKHAEGRCRTLRDALGNKGLKFDFQRYYCKTQKKKPDDEPRGFFKI